MGVSGVRAPRLPIPSGVRGPAGEGPSGVLGIPLEAGIGGVRGPVGPGGSPGGLRGLCRPLPLFQFSLLTSSLELIGLSRCR